MRRDHTSRHPHYVQTAQAPKVMASSMHSSPASCCRSVSWSDGDFKSNFTLGKVYPWRSESSLPEPHAPPLRSSPLPMSASADSSRLRNTTVLLHHRDHHSSSAARPRKKSLSSLDFELALWQKAADKRAARKIQLEKLAALKKLARNAAANRAVNHHSGMVLPSDVKQSAVLLQWRIIIALAIVSAVAVSLSWVWLPS